MTSATLASEAPVAPRDHGIPFGEAVCVWARVAALSFGGPAGQIAVMHRILVDEKKWIGEGRFLHALNYCMLLPGPEAQQLAAYIGWLLHKTKGGLVAGALRFIPRDAGSADNRGAGPRAGPWPRSAFRASRRGARGSRSAVRQAILSGPGAAA